MVLKNKDEVYQIIKENPWISREIISEYLNISSEKVTEIIRELRKEGKVRIKIFKEKVWRVKIGHE